MELKYVVPWSILIRLFAGDLGGFLFLDIKSAFYIMFLFQIPKIILLSDFFIYGYISFLYCKMSINEKLAI